MIQANRIKKLWGLILITQNIYSIYAIISKLRTEDDQVDPGINEDKIYIKEIKGNINMVGTNEDIDNPLILSWKGYI